MVLIGLGACQRETAIPIQVTSRYPIVALETTVADLSPTPKPTAANTVTPTVVSTETDTPATTTVPVIDKTLTATPIATSTPVFPDWLAVTDANILMLYSDRNDTISLIDVESGKRHDINVEVDDFGPSWLSQEGRYFLIPVNRNLEHNMRVLDIETGEFSWVEQVSQKGLSTNRRYLALIAENSTELVSIIDYETGTETQLANPFGNLRSRDEDFNEYAANLTWSPDNRFLSVIYMKHYYSDNFDLNLVIYTPSGEIYRQYASINVAWPSYWAPVLPYRILYTERSRACLLQVIENERACIEAVDVWLANQDVILLNHTWSPDGNRISYTYLNSDSLTPDSGVCYYELATEKIVCPITRTDLQFDEQRFARRLFWSPDGKYLAVFFDDIGYSEDLFGSVGIIVVNIENQETRLIEGEYSWPFYNPWRPLMFAQINE